MHPFLVHGTPSRRVRVAFGVWLAACAVWFALLASEAAFGSTSCEFSPGSSDYGSATWHWLPPGISCRYVVDGRVHTDDPPTARSGLLLVLLAWPLTLAFVARGREGGGTE
jgi:hypothetical protein